MWPNITVEVERRPARCEASMISTQRATGSLFGEMRWRTPSSSTSAAVPGVESRPHSSRYSKTAAGSRPERSHMKWISIGEYACRWISGATSFASRSQRP
jgi:hypothetical protein